MSENTKLVPKRRFKDFQNTDAWEQRKLGELSNSFEYGLNAAATEYDGENKYIRITDIDDESRRFIETDLTSPKIDLSNAENYKLKIGDILFARTGASVGKSYIYKASDGLVYYAGFLIRARIKPEYDAEFVFQSTLTSKYNEYIRINSQRSGQPGVNAQEYAEFSFQVPDSEEQFKIGVFFRNLDNLITLHQRKLEKMKALKSAYLSDMFPIEGEREPKRRFAGFTDPWEQRKLGELLTVHSFKPYLAEPQIGGNYKVIQQGDNPIAGYANGKPFQSYEEITLFGDHTLSLYKAKCPFFVASDGLKILSSQELDGRFLFSLLERCKPSSEGYKRHYCILKEVEAFYPKSTDEQVQIGNYFEFLDNLITLHQRKLEKLQSIKKAYLNEMFI